jgi:anaerobic selenocysteine-containing dehydrogenase
MTLTSAPGEDGVHATFCRLCEAQCGMLATVEEGRITHVGPDRNHPVSQRHICVKGPGMADITYDQDRVVTPLKRVGEAGNFEPVSWDEALDEIAARLKAIIARHGGDSIGLYQGNPASFSTMHAAYAGGFLNALGGSKSFSTLHVDTGAKMLVGEFVFGNPIRMSFPDLERCDFLLMLGANPLVSHISLVAEPRVRQKLQEIAARGAVVMVDPRRTETARRFEHVPVRPDSDAWLLAGMLKTLFDEGLVAEERLDETVVGWRELRSAVTAVALDRAAALCGVDAPTIQSLARRFVSARTAAAYGRVGTNRGSFSTLTNVFIEALNIVTGRFGEPGGLVIGQPPLGGPKRKWLSPYGSRRSRIGNLPLLMGGAPGGTLADEILTPGEGQMRVLFLDSGNPVMAFPRGDRIAEALDQLEPFVSLDLYVTESSRHADYILPATTFFERADITEFWLNNAPRPWLQHSDAVIAPVGEARHEYDIYDAILERLDLPGSLAALALEPGVRPVLIDLADRVLRSGRLGDRFGENPERLSIARLREEFPSGMQPMATVDAAASWAQIDHEDGRPHLWNDVIAGEMARLITSQDSDTATLKLFGRRKLGSMNSWMHNSKRLVRSDRPTLRMHPDDACERQIRDGQTVRINDSAGALEVKVEISDEVIAGSVNYPHGWGHKGGWRHAATLPGANINRLASADPADWEQVSGNVLLDGIPVTVQAVGGEAR